MQKNLSSQSTPPDDTAANDGPEDAERRAALARLGAMAAWTAPAMIALVASRRASASSTPPPPTTPNF